MVPSTSFLTVNFFKNPYFLQKIGSGLHGAKWPVPKGLKPVSKWWLPIEDLCTRCTRPMYRNFLSKTHDVHKNILFLNRMFSNFHHLLWSLSYKFCANLVRFHPWIRTRASIFRWNHLSQTGFRINIIKYSMVVNRKLPQHTGHSI